MSDTDSDADSTSDPSNAHSYYADGGDEALISSDVRELCNQLRANDPRLLADGSVFELCNYTNDCVFELFNFTTGCSEDECIATFQALKENTSVKRFAFKLSERHYTKRSVLAAAEYLESSQTLQILELHYDGHFQEIPMIISVLFRALSRNTSVTKLIIFTDVVRFASVAFQELLTCTQTIQKLQISGFKYGDLDEVQTAAIASGFANNTTLRDVDFYGWREADLAPVLTALRDHPALQKINLREAGYSNYLLECNTGGLHTVMQELGRNTVVTNLSIRDSGLSREIAQQLKAVFCQNTALQHLTLEGNRLRNAGLAEIASGLHRNTSIKTLDLSSNGLDDIESANALRELLRRNETITSLCLANNTFGRNAPAVRSIAEGVSSNTALQQLDLNGCELNDQGISFLANALATRNASLRELDRRGNRITSVGVRALVDDNMEAMKTPTKLCLTCNPVRSEGATILANALGTTPCRLSNDSIWLVVV
jgi:Ran GTPase-activating protein (RanGAP) involved in mRNA processing and transport